MMSYPVRDSTKKIDGKRTAQAKDRTRRLKVERRVKHANQGRVK